MRRKRAAASAPPQAAAATHRKYDATGATAKQSVRIKTVVDRKRQFYAPLQRNEMRPRADPLATNGSTRVESRSTKSHCLILGQSTRRASVSNWVASTISPPGYLRLSDWPSKTCPLGARCGTPCGVTQHRTTVSEARPLPPQASDIEPGSPQNQSSSAPMIHILARRKLKASPKL
jgi:hypothetical protein